MQSMAHGCVAGVGSQADLSSLRLLGRSEDLQTLCKWTSTLKSSNGTSSSASVFLPLRRSWTARTSKDSKAKWKGMKVRCSGGTIAVSESDEQPMSLSTSTSEYFDRVTSPSLVEFRMSDFDLCTHVSIGLAGRGDEVVYEALVRNSDSPLKGSKVVLRQLAGPRAQRWGKRAVQVIAKLVRKQELYRSYATCIHGFILPCSGSEENLLTLVHGYYDSYSLHHWLLREDWLPTLEARLAMDEECSRRVGDDRTGGSAVSRQLRVIQILMRDLLIGVNYLHSHGLAHTELRLQNVQISEADRHVKVGLLGNATDFVDVNAKDEEVINNLSKKVSRRQLMIAYDIRCAGMMMARMVLRELMDPAIFGQFKAFLTKGNDPAGLREFLMPIICRKSPSGSPGLQILDRDGGAGWNLLTLMLASKPSDRVSCTEALRHRFLCGPKWRVESSIEMTRWNIGSTAVRIVEEYIYGPQQRNRLAQLLELLEMINPNQNVKSWLELLPGKWRLVYHTGKQIGLTLRQASPAVLIGHLFQLFKISDGRLSVSTNVDFTVMPEKGNWAPNKDGIKGSLEISSDRLEIASGERKYETQEQNEAPQKQQPVQKLDRQVKISGRRTKGTDSSHQTQWKVPHSSEEAMPAFLPVVRLNPQEIEMSMRLDYTGNDPSFASKVLREVRIEIPQDSFDISNIVCGTYIDTRLLVLRGVSGAALLFVRSPMS